MDRAALDVALELGIACGGWCPKGRRAEDGPLEPRYPLRETRSTSYPERTERNVLDSDGTLVLAGAEIKGGTALTVRLASRHARPLLRVNLDQRPSAHDVRRWIEDNAVRVLNVAGPRESERPGIYEEAAVFLREILSRRR